MNVREIVWEGVDWIYLAKDRGQWRVAMNTGMNIWVPHKGGKSFY